VNEKNEPVPLTSDQDLIQRVQRGDSEAFTALFYAHRPRIYSVCLRMTNNVAEAEDLTQDAFLQVFRKLTTFRGDSALSTWLYRVAVNTVLMHFRKRALRQISLDEPCRQKDGRSVRRDYGIRDERLAGSVDRIALARAIRELPAGYRTIFLLHEVEGYEHQEIARLLECSVGNSKSQLHKAKERIKQFLDGTNGSLWPARRRHGKMERRTGKHVSGVAELRAGQIPVEPWRDRLATRVTATVTATAPSLMGA
jgi:RNA polymerase sigma-70 factor (ECF subfamily)